MSKQKEAAVRQAVEEVWNRGNLDAVPALFSSKLVSRDPQNREVCGRAGFKELVQAYHSAYSDLHFTIEDSLVSGNEVTVWLSAAGKPHNGRRGSDNGAGPVKWNGLTIYRFAHDKIAELWFYWDTVGMLQAPSVAATGC